MRLNGLRLLLSKDFLQAICCVQYAVADITLALTLDLAFLFDLLRIHFIVSLILINFQLRVSPLSLLSLICLLL